MDWSNERYVRLYTRDSVTWSLLSWEAQALLCFLLRKVDRAGVMDLGGNEPARAVAAGVRMPLDVVERTLPELTKAGVFEIGATAIVMPNYIEAQEAKSSDKQRQSESRGRRRDRARAGADVTQCDTSSQPVTRGHDVSHDVTPSLAEPSQAEPSCTERESPAKPATRAREPEVLTIHEPEMFEGIRLAEYMLASIRRHTPGFRSRQSKAQDEKTVKTWAKPIRDLIKLDGKTPEQIRAVIDRCHNDPSDEFEHGNVQSGAKLRKRWDNLWAKTKSKRRGHSRQPDLSPLQNFDFHEASKIWGSQ